MAFAVAPTAVPSEVIPGKPGRPGSRRAFQRVRLRAVRIAFDVSPLSHPPTGVGNYIRGSLAGLPRGSRRCSRDRGVRADEHHRAEGIHDALDGLDVELRTWRLPFSHAVRTAWSVVGRPRRSSCSGRFDVLHFSDWMYPAQRSGVRSTMIHDLVPVRFPEWTTKRTRAMHGRKYRNAARSCHVVFVNSAYTGGDVTKLLGVPPARIRVAPPGIKPVFAPDGPRAELGAPYIVTVATLEPRKNLQALAAAHRLLGGDTLLAVVGGEGWGEQPMLDDPRVRRLGFVSDDELAALYRGAAAAAYPSRFEGFGMPIVEAMASGTAVVASAHPSMDEASGDAALRADPDDPDAIAAASSRRSRRTTRSSGVGRRMRPGSPGTRPARRCSEASSRRL